MPNSSGGVAALSLKKAIERDINYTVKVFSGIAPKEHGFGINLLS
jgi:hypothetical protein